MYPFESRQQQSLLQALQNPQQQQQPIFSPADKRAMAQGFAAQALQGPMPVMSEHQGTPVNFGPSPTQQQQQAAMDLERQRGQASLDVEKERGRNDLSRGRQEGVQRLAEINVQSHAMTTEEAMRDAVRAWARNNPTPPLDPNAPQGQAFQAVMGMDDGRPGARGLVQRISRVPGANVQQGQPIPRRPVGDVIVDLLNPENAASLNDDGVADAIDALRVLYPGNKDGSFDHLWGSAMRHPSAGQEAEWRFSTFNARQRLADAVNRQLERRGHQNRFDPRSTVWTGSRYYSPLPSNVSSLLRRGGEPGGVTATPAAGNWPGLQQQMSAQGGEFGMW